MCLPLYIYVPHMQMPKEASMISREAAVTCCCESPEVGTGNEMLLL